VTEVTQTLFAGETEGVYGNCLQAAVASYFDLPLDAVPHFNTFEHAWMDALQWWCYGKFRMSEEYRGVTEIPQERCILLGRSNRGYGHAVVAEGGQIVWDPHPSRDGLESFSAALLFRPESTGQ
jgi:hypothetical protein